MIEKQPVIRNRYALLIGVRDYVDKNYRTIPQTVNDVKALEKVLTEFGYTVSLLYSDHPEQDKKPTRANIWAELRNIAGMTEKGDLLLVHFGGHGDIDSDNKAYLIPYDGRKSALRESAIDLEEFKQEIVDAGAQGRVLILDACHSGIGRDDKGMSAEFERHVFLEAEGTAILASCHHGELAYEHDETNHGAFTYFLLEGLKGKALQRSQHFITFDDVKDYVTKMVKGWAFQKGKRQVPNYQTGGVGNLPLVELPQTSSHSEIISPNPVGKTKNRDGKKISWKILIPLIVLPVLIFIGLVFPGLLNNGESNNMPSNPTVEKSSEVKRKMEETENNKKSYLFYLEKGIREYKNENGDAIYSFKMALEFYPNDPESLYYLALTYKNLSKDHTKAYENLKQAIENGFKNIERAREHGFQEFLGNERFQRLFQE